MRVIDSVNGDCGTESNDAVFTAKILTFNPVRARNGRNLVEVPGATDASDVRLTVEPEEVFKGRPGQKLG